MIKRFKCWLYGHDLVQKGFNRIRHTFIDEESTEWIATRDHFLFICRRCCCIQEFHCDNHYYDISENAPVYSTVDEEEED